MKKFLLSSSISCFLSLGALAAPLDPVTDYLQTTQSNLCSATRTEFCLKEIELPKTNSPKTSQAVQQSVQSPVQTPVLTSPVYTLQVSPGITRVDPHLIHGYTLKKLVRAFAYDPRLEKKVLDQLDYLFKFGQYVEKPGVSAGFADTYGFLNGMVQSEYASLFLVLSKTFSQMNRTLEAERFYRLSILFVNSVGTIPRKGTPGLRSVSNSCGPKKSVRRECFWFYSGNAFDKSHPGTALNQMLHVIRDLNSYRFALRKDLRTIDFPAEFNTTKEDFLTRLESWVTSGLWQLAYSQGRVKGKESPPNLRQFLNYKCVDGRCYYMAFYSYNIATAQGRNNKLNASTCHYHTHTLQVFGDIYSSMLSIPMPEDGRRALMDMAKFQVPTKNGTLVPEVVGVKAAQFPLYQLYQTEIDPALKNTRQGCPAMQEEQLGERGNIFKVLFGETT